MESLVDDISTTLLHGKQIADADAERFGRDLASIISSRLAPREENPTLRMSNLGSPCSRKLWYSVNQSDRREALSASTRLKFLYGDILESLVLFLARISGHDVKGEQDELEIEGIKGHRDAVIDGVTVDVKSASSYSFLKFREGLDDHNDSFGYRDQLGSYVFAGREHQVESHPTRGAFLAVDKQLGHLTLDEHEFEKDYVEHVRKKKAVVEAPNPPPRAFFDEPDGKSGNRKLGVQCGYCEFKRTCYPNLRSFAYSNGPRHLTKVVREPDVPEIGVDDTADGT